MIGDNVEVGCGSILNPGSVIGKNTNIYPLSSVRGVIKANSIYKNMNEIVEKKQQFGVDSFEDNLPLYVN